MKFLVRFPTPVVYQPDHPRVRALVQELIVHAPDARGAEVHAIRMVAGDVSGLTVEPYIPVFVPPPVELPNTPTIRINADAAIAR